jgi:hypothetical protein
MTKKETSKFSDWPGPRVGKGRRRKVVGRKSAARKAKKAKVHRKKR